MGSAEHPYYVFMRLRGPGSDLVEVWEPGGRRYIETSVNKMFSSFSLSSPLFWGIVAVFMLVCAPKKIHKIWPLFVVLLVPAKKTVLRIATFPLCRP
jgi:hypothetical protein